MTPTTGTLLTAKEFAKLPDPPDGSQQELVRGTVISLPRPGFRQGDVQANAFFLLSVHVRKGKPGRVTVESGVQTERDPDSVRGPDVAFWSYERLPAKLSPIGYPDVTADLVVEVLSPSQPRKQMAAKVEEYLAAGVRVVWVANPDDQTVAVCRPGEPEKMLSSTETLVAEDVLPGFRCQVAELFA